MPSKDPFETATVEDLTSSGAWKMRLGLNEERQRMLEESLSDHRSVTGERLAAIDTRVAQIYDAQAKTVVTLEEVKRELHILMGRVAVIGAICTAAIPIITAALQHWMK